MIQELDVARDVYIDRDTDGQVLHLRHLGSPYAVPAATPQLAASHYLHSFGDLIGRLAVLLLCHAVLSSR